MKGHLAHRCAGGPANRSGRKAGERDSTTQTGVEAESAAASDSASVSKKYYDFLPEYDYEEHIKEIEDDEELPF